MSPKTCCCDCDRSSESDRECQGHQPASQPGLVSGRDPPSPPPSPFPYCTSFSSHQSLQLFDLSIFETDFFRIIHNTTTGGKARSIKNSPRTTLPSALHRPGENRVPRAENRSDSASSRTCNGIMGMISLVDHASQGGNNRRPIQGHTVRRKGWIGKQSEQVNPSVTLIAQR